MDIINFIDTVWLISTTCHYKIAQLIITPYLTAMQMRLFYCYRCSSVVCLSVGRSVILLIRAKMAEPIEMPFGVWTWMCQRNHALVGVSRSPKQMSNFEGRKRSLHGKRLTERVQWNQSHGETPVQVHFSCKKLCWKVTKYVSCDELCQSTKFLNAPRT